MRSQENHGADQGTSVRQTLTVPGFTSSALSFSESKIRLGSWCAQSILQCWNNAKFSRHVLLGNLRWRTLNSGYCRRHWTGLDTWRKFKLLLMPNAVEWEYWKLTLTFYSSYAYIASVCLWDSERSDPPGPKLDGLKVAEILEETKEERVRPRPKVILKLACQ